MIPYDVGWNPREEIFHELEGESHEEYEEITRGTLKNKPNYTSTRLKSTQDPPRYINNKRNKGT